MCGYVSRALLFVGKYNVLDARASEMIAVMWKPFNFHHQITEQNQRHVPVCCRCFAEPTLLGHFSNL